MMNRCTGQISSEEATNKSNGNEPRVAHPLVLSHFQAKPLLDARKRGLERLRSSSDLGLSESEAVLDENGAEFPGLGRVGWNDLEKIAESGTSCFALGDGGMEKIQAFSEATGRPVSLYPTPGAPTVLVAGRSMHRIKGTDPWADTIQKIKAVEPVTGRVLDTTTGLGYTAILAAKTAQRVDTVELDPVVSEIARLNPWSRGLFENPKIVRRIGDSFEVADDLPEAAFSRIIHDPPEFALAGGLYSLKFYRKLFRLLAPGGRIFHYIGNPESASGARNTAGVAKRLAEAGFARVKACPAAFGLTAVKGARGFKEK